MTFLLRRLAYKAPSASVGAFQTVRFLHCSHNFSRRLIRPVASPSRLLQPVVFRKFSTSAATPKFLSFSLFHRAAWLTLFGTGAGALGMMSIWGQQVSASNTATSNSSNSSNSSGSSTNPDDSSSSSSSSSSASSATRDSGDAEESHHLITSSSSIHLTEHSRLVWCWLYAKRLCFLFINFLPLVLMFPLVYIQYDNPRYSGLKQSWLSLLRDRFGRGGSTFIKLAQWISMRQDIFGHEICVALAHLRVEAPMHSFEETCAVIEESFGRGVNDIFEQFYIQPVASGSIAQIHRASLRDESGALVDVAVKVRHPKIVEDMSIDIDLLYMLSRLIRLKMPIYQATFTQYLRSQIDLRLESNSLQTFNKNFNGYDGSEAFRGEEGKKGGKTSGGVVFPKPVKSLVTDACLVETWENGIPLSYLNFSKLTMKTRRSIARQCYDIFMNMLLRDNFVHGDCHSGNILIKSSSYTVGISDAGQEGSEQFDMDKGCNLVFLDAGLVARLTEEGSDKIGRLMTCIASGKTEAAAKLFAHWCMFDTNGSRDRFVTGLSEMIESHLEWTSVLGKKIPKIGNIGNLFHDVLYLTQKEQVTLDSQFSAVIASLGVVEGLIKDLDPTADFLVWGIPYLLRFRGLKVDDNDV